jgi:hypothetical protein
MRHRLVAEPRIRHQTVSGQDLRWRLGRGPAAPPLRVTEQGEIEPKGPVARGLLAIARRIR